MHHPNPRASNVSGEDEHGHADCELQRLIESLVWKKRKIGGGVVTHPAAVRCEPQKP